MVLRKPVELRSSLRDNWNRISEYSKTLANADFAGVFLNYEVLRINTKMPRNKQVGNTQVTSR